MTSLAEAQGVVLGACHRSAPLDIEIDNAVGLVLAQPVSAAYPVPPFDTSAMDGYALVAADTSMAPARLEVVGRILAGASPTMTVGPGRAAKIMTGAPIPRGADAVCMIEKTVEEDDGARVVVAEPVAPGTAVRRAGEDIGSGDTVFARGEVLSPSHVGVLASLGHYRVAVHPRIRVGVLSTGDELREGPGPLDLGQIRDSNRHALMSRLCADGYEVDDLGIVRDDPGDISQAITLGAGRCDALVTSGGVSVGDVDYVKLVLDRLSSGTMRWMQVDIRPARPFAFGTLDPDGTPVFGLPGNPVSALVSYELFVRPALRQVGGYAQIHRPIVAAVADTPMSRARDGKLHLVRVAARFESDGFVHVHGVGRQESHLLRTMARANGLAIVADGEGVDTGDRVDVLLMDAGEMPQAG